MTTTKLACRTEKTKTKTKTKKPSKEQKGKKHDVVRGDVCDT